MSTEEEDSRKGEDGGKLVANLDGEFGERRRIQELNWSKKKHNNQFITRHLILFYSSSVQTSDRRGETNIGRLLLRIISKQKKREHGQGAWKHIKWKYLNVPISLNIFYCSHFLTKRVCILYFILLYIYFLLFLILYQKVHGI